MPHPDHLPAYTAYCQGPRSSFVGGPFDAVKAFDKLCSMSGHWTMRGFGRYVITTRDSGQAIGHVGALQLDPSEPPEMTWTLWDAAFEGQGTAFEAARAYLDHARRVLDCSSLTVRIAADNQRSHALAIRLGAIRTDQGPPPWMPTAVSYRIDL